MLAMAALVGVPLLLLGLLLCECKVSNVRLRCAGIPGQKLPPSSAAPPKPATPSWPEGNRMQPPPPQQPSQQAQQQQQQQPPVSASTLQQVGNHSYELSTLFRCSWYL